MRCRHLLVLLPLVAGVVPPAGAAVSVSVGISMPGVQIGINVPAYPTLVAVPGYPVYYAPGLRLNYFFYDGLYWVYQGDGWYSSDWYAGPWVAVQPDAVPVFILRVPVRYYVAPPAYFRPWQPEAPPRWGWRWGPRWEERHRDWAQWDRRTTPPPAPLPEYQRHFSGGRYPGRDQQLAIRQAHERSQPRDPQVRQVDARMQQAQPRPFAREEPGARPPVEDRPAMRPAPPPAAAPAPRAQPATQPREPSSQRGEPPREAPHTEPPREAQRFEPPREASHGEPPREQHAKREPERRSPNEDPHRGEP